MRPVLCASHLCGAISHTVGLYRPSPSSPIPVAMPAKADSNDTRLLDILTHWLLTVPPAQPERVWDLTEYMLLSYCWWGRVNMSLDEVKRVVQAAHRAERLPIRVSERLAAVASSQLKTTRAQAEAKRTKRAADKLRQAQLNYQAAFRAAQAAVRAEEERSIQQQMREDEMVEAGLASEDEDSEEEESTAEPAPCPPSLQRDSDDDFGDDVGDDEDACGHNSQTSPDANMMGVEPSSDELYEQARAVQERALQAWRRERDQRRQMDERADLLRERVLLLTQQQLQLLGLPDPAADGNKRTSARPVQTTSSETTPASVQRPV